MISIIIPTYRPQDYLWQCLDSFAAQTLDKRLWELVVVLNGESEPWLNQLKDYRDSHPDMHIQIFHTETTGVSNARNIGLDKAKGEYIGFVDDDDYVSPTYLEELASIATPDTVSAAFSIAFDETHDHIPYYIEAAYHRYAPKGTMPYYIARTYFSGPCMKLFHHDIIGKRRFDTNFVFGEDSLFMFAISNRLQKIAFTSQKAVYYRRMRKSSASHTNTHLQRVLNCLRISCQYTHIYIHGRGYNLSFYLTRILGALHTIIYQP